MRQVDVQH